MALTSLKPIFSSQQQQEALPDETEVVEETVAEGAEVGGGEHRPPHSFPGENRMGAVGSRPRNGAFAHTGHTQHRCESRVSPNPDAFLNASQTSHGTLELGTMILKFFIFKL